MWQPSWETGWLSTAAWATFAAACWRSWSVNSAVLQELTFQKKQLLEKIVVALPDQKIRDLRFRIGVVK